MLFGEYLMSRDLVTEKQLLAALDEQLRSRPFSGTIAAELGYLGASQVLRVLHMQSVTRERFLSTAYGLGFLTEEQCEQVLTVQRERQRSVGHVLLEHGSITAQQLKSALRSYFTLEESKHTAEHPDAALV